MICGFFSFFFVLWEGKLVGGVGWGFRWVVRREEVGEENGA